MAAKAVHISEAGRNASIAHGDGHLMQRFGQGGPEIPVIFGAAHIGARIAFNGMVEIREF
ncbi:MAG: hypothetical protein ACD_34C00465G0001 [uncultured bacterium]|nr:MAG: hypothetical protein ACD_34C00465G0001 [uncultured bacterium]